MPMNGPSLGGLAIGSLLLYSAIKGKSILATTQAVISGKSPATVKKTEDIISPVPTDTKVISTVTPTGSGRNAAATEAVKYIGHCYQYGGAPGANGQGCWDCSSFANWIYGTVLKLPIPGFAPGTYNGQVHGPATLSWIVFGTAVTGGSAAAQPGDLCVWQTHMGIAIGGGKMISALNPGKGTLETSIDGIIKGEVLSVRRI
jgi:cell wall-associated NlpC family hydrolase